LDWYNQHRPHSTLGGQTPDELYFERFPANRRPRLEPRSTWPRGSPCALPHALVAGKPGARLTWKLSISPDMPTCRLSDCDARRSLFCVSELLVLLVRTSPPSHGLSRRTLPQQCARWRVHQRFIADTASKR